MVKDSTTCEICFVKTKSNRLGRDGFLCSKCYRRKTHEIGTRLNDFIPQKNLKEVLSKVYEVDAYVNSRGNLITTHIPCPQILIGHKVKLVLVKDSQTNSKEKSE